jgi:hypothetical protein
LDKKIFIILTLLIYILFIFSGCIENDYEYDSKITNSKNSAPIPIITAPKKAFFEELIEFDASNSYDNDGEINSYSWEFGDNTTSSGEKTSHKYEFNKNYNYEFPIEYSVVLKIVDDNGSWEYKTHNIQLYPKSYIIYLETDRLTFTKPIKNSQSFKTSLGLLKINSIKEFSYHLPTPINLTNSIWNITIYLEKPRFSILNIVRINLLSSKDKIIGMDELKLKTFDLWSEKILTFNGRITNTQDFHSIKIMIYGHSLMNNFMINYGGDNPSSIKFDFYI